MDASETKCDEEGEAVDPCGSSMELEEIKRIAAVTNYSEGETHISDVERKRTVVWRGE